MRESIEDLGGRRFLMCLFCSAICTGALFCGVLTSEDFRWIILGTVGIYVGGNTGQKIWGVKNVEQN